MQLLDERGRALINSMLRAPESIQLVCEAARRDPAATEELVSLVWLLTGAVLTLEHALAYRPREVDEAVDGGAFGRLPEPHEPWMGEVISANADD